MTVLDPLGRDIPPDADPHQNAASHSTRTEFMNLKRLAQIALLATAPLTGCADRVALPVTADAERSELTARTLALQASVADGGALTTAQQRALNALAADIRSWQSRTGRNDIAVSTTQPRPIGPAGAVALLEKAPPSGPSGCTPCPAVTASGGKICFLVEAGSCNNSTDIRLHVCVYTCITLDPGAVPSRHR
jgi:hypothetical protein